MEVTVKRKVYHGQNQVTYEPICKWAKIIAKIAITKNLSIRMINILKENGVKIIEVEKEERQKKLWNKKSPHRKTNSHVGQPIFERQP